MQWVIKLAKLVSQIVQSDSSPRDDLCAAQNDNVNYGKRYSVIFEYSIVIIVLLIALAIVVR